MAVSAKIHWRLNPRDHATLCGHLVQGQLWRAAELRTTTESREVTCRACLRHNPGSVSKERAWHYVPANSHAVCGLWVYGTEFRARTQKQVTCKSCLRVIKSKSYKKRHRRTRSLITMSTETV